MVGLGEEARAPNFNRGLYELWGHVDSLLEKDDAVLDLIDVMGLVGTKYSLDGGLLTEKLVYLGPEGTKTTADINPGVWCSNYLKIRAYGGIDSLVNPATRIAYFISDVHGNLAGGISCYVALPTSAQVYPYGTCARIASIGPPHGAGDIVFAPAVPPIGGTPSGITPIPTSNPVGLLNYSLLERILSGAVVPADVVKAFATCMNAPGVFYTTNRDGVNLEGLAVAGWLVGDLVYTTHFALSPVVCFNANVADMNTTLLLGTFSPAGRGPTERFMDLLRMADMGTVLPLPITSTEPTGATYGSFDYANALFRARDGTLKGTVGFDADMGSFSPAGNWDVYAGFVHRRRIKFANVATTQITLNAPCNYVSLSNTVTLTGVDVFWTGTTAGTHLILGVDLVELYDSLGKFVGLFTLATFPGVNKAATLERLDGTTPAVGVDVLGGSISISRPIFRTGGMLGPGGASIQGNLLLGDHDSTGSDLPALTMFSGGATNLLTGYDFPVDARNNGTVGGDSGCVFQVSSDGQVSWGPRKGSLWVSHGAKEMWQHKSEVVHEAAPLRLRFADRSIMEDPAGDDARFRDSVLFDSSGAALNRVIATSFRTTPNASAGLSRNLAANIADIDFASALVLGDPGYLFDPAGGPNYGGVVAGDYSILGAWPPGLGANSRLITGLFAQGNGRIDGHPALFAGIVEGNQLGTVAYPPKVGGLDTVSHRFMITWDGADAYRTMNYGWESARTFYHNIPMPAGETHGNWVMNFGGAPGAPIRSTWRLTGPITVQQLVFPLNLPDGATIVRVLIYGWYVKGGASVGTGSASLIQCPFDNLVVETSDTSVGSPQPLVTAANNVFTINPVSAAEVRNSAYQYQILLSITPALGTDTFTVFGARVEYSMQDFLPA